MFTHPFKLGFLSGSVVKKLPANSRNVSWISELGRSPAERNGKPLQDSCLEHPMDREGWQAVIREVATELDMT